MYKRQAESQHLLGFLHREGRGVLCDLHRAFWWFSRAAQQGYAPAQVSLGIVTLRGEGTRSDPCRAVGYFERAASQGEAAGQRHLARCYASGVGVGQDPREAFKWATLAAEAGDEEAEELRSDLAVHLSTKDRWDARARAQAFALAVDAD